MPATPDPLKPLDVVAVLWIAHRARTPWQRIDLAAALDVSPSMVTYALARVEAAGVLDADTQRVVPAALRDVLPAIRWFLPAGPSHLVGWGMPTGHAAPGLDLGIKGRPYVWEVPARGGPLPSEAWIEGQVVAPMHPCVPGAAGRDAAFHRVLAAVDAVRVGTTRERQLALEALGRLLHLEGVS